MQEADMQSRYFLKKKRNREVKAETAGSDEKGRVKMERGKRRSEK